MVIGGVLPSYAVIYRSPDLISLSFLPASPPACSPCRHRLHILCSLHAHLNNFASVRAGGFKFREEADGDRYVRGGTFGGSRTREKRTWWTDGSAEEEFDDEDYELDDDETIWDKIWIFKVFKAYGYFLPAIIISMLLATGPKAFLMALALPLGQSALSLVFEKVMGKDNERAKRRSKANKWASGRSWYGSRSKAVREEEKEGSKRDYSKDYKSWVAADTGVAGQKVAQPPADGYGGWDELDRREFRKAKVPSAGSAPRVRHVKKERLTRKGRSKDMPFFWRMLVAVFPFLGSLTKLLW